jgi:hypothetical protein
VKRIYIAGPYTLPSPAVNTERAMIEGHALLDLGFAPLVPHLTHFMELARHRPHEEWMQLDFRHRRNTR